MSNKCSKCGGDNFSFAAVNDTSCTHTKHRGLTYSLIRSMLVLCTCGLWLLVPKSKEKSKSKHKSKVIRICNNCGKTQKA